MAATIAGLLGAGSAAVAIQTWLDERLEPGIVVSSEHAAKGPCMEGQVIPQASERLGPAPADEGLSGREERERWAEEHGAVDVGFTAAQVTVRGTSERAIILTGLSIDVVRREPPLRGTRFAEACGDALPVRYLGADLDRTPPIAELAVDDRREAEQDGAEPLARIDFPYAVTSSDPEIFVILGYTRTCYCEWTAVLHWRDGEEDGQSVIADEGEPFRVTTLVPGLPIVE